MIEICIFEYNEEHPFTKMLFFSTPYHYSYKADRYGNFSFEIHAYDTKFIPEDDYSMVFCVEKMGKIKEEDPAYQYYIIPRARLKQIDEGVVITALEISIELPLLGTDKLKGVMFVSDKKYSVTERTVYELLLLTS